ncbi:hypothetical protein GJ633_14115 [Halorubrum sp. CBA1125]|uniref:hypothetical protein n=1 Tax=Halorubrum sp. CBA1125 TaxID=2668072 RepID=UPI0012E7E76B|nr:hypothetical protein [Halorubrum sp. CBA1125]MUW15637.1 hypothetical protein [Halorubrum sp. CBA1125]
MNLDELRSAQAKERRKDSLQHLRDSFYDDVAAYVADLRAARDRRAEQVDNPFADDDVRRLSDEVETAEEVAEALYERRVGKVVKLASFAAADMPVDEEGMTTEERALFDDLVDRIAQNKSRVLDVLAGDAPVDDVTTGGGEAPADGSPSDGPPADGSTETVVSPTGTDGDDAVEAPSDRSPRSDAAARDGGTRPDETTDAPPPAQPADAPPREQSAESPSVASHPAESNLAEDHPADDGALADAMGGAGDAVAEALDAAEPGEQADGAVPAGEGPGDGDPGDDDPGGGTTDGGRTAVPPEPAPPGAPDAVETDEPSTGRNSAAAATGDASSAEGRPADDPPTDRATVRITRDVGSIFGVDEREYDLASEDVVTLPVANADPLVERDAAERLD